MNDIVPGRVAIPRAGRDRGRPMLVLRVEGEYAYLADGKLRRVEKPKKKKLRHLLPQKELLGNFLEMLEDGRTPLDAEVKKALEAVESRKEG